MADSGGNPSTFLKTVSAPRPQTANPRGSLDLMAAPGSGEPIVLADLHKTSGLDFVSFAASVDELVSLGLVTLSGSPGEETAQLSAVAKPPVGTTPAEH